ncbi:MULTISPECIES: hypothetical protein [unclassified Streptomyces]|uniref:hypothetical protein n=1 Tax=unclassified Streptomyces TaxID=2593676 RepID=UPI001E49C1A3|nr:hypothetical protein [Streptomyces sp. MBT42]MCD2463332.1 hypothetical protein [Streptomyces sp. MBT42]
MRAIRAASAALLSAAAVVATVAPAAMAGEDDHNITSFGFSVSPETVAPGGSVTLKSDGCEVPSVTVTSGVFDTVTLNEGRSGNATVDIDAKAGAQYEITFDCKGERGTATLTISQGGTGGHPTGHEESPPPGAHKGVKAGYGTAAASGADTDGLGVTEVVTGVLLIVGALGAAVVLTRRRATDGRL